MQPDSVGTEAGTAAVVSAIFFAFAAASIGNLLLSKFKLYIVLFIASACANPLSFIVEVIELNSLGSSFRPTHL